MNRNINCLGLYAGFTVMIIQTIVGDVYRNNKTKQHNEKLIQLLKSKL